MPPRSQDFPMGDSLPPLRPPAKTRVQAQQAEHKSKAHAAFRTAIVMLRESGMTLQALEDQMALDKHALLDVCDGKRNLLGWHIDALPKHARDLFFRELEGAEPARSGTHG
jgi:hypothetical protein